MRIDDVPKYKWYMVNQPTGWSCFISNIYSLDNDKIFSFLVNNLTEGIEIKYIIK